MEARTEPTVFEVAILRASRSVGTIVRWTAWTATVDELRQAEVNLEASAGSLDEESRVQLHGELEREFVIAAVTVMDVAAEA